MSELRAEGLAPALDGRRGPEHVRMLWIDPRGGTIRSLVVADLPGLLGPGDLVVLNDAATVPASLRARTVHDDPVEVRLAAWLDGPRWTAILFGAGDHRTPTERRPPPPHLEPGARLCLEGTSRTVRLVAAGPRPRLVEVELGRDEREAWETVYAHGRPVQYAHRPLPLSLSEVQTPWADRPWAVEMPSAARPISRATVLALRGRGVDVAWVTHAAGLSSTGDPTLDSMLPLPERYDVPAETVRAVGRARSRGRSVLAVGTTVARALEGCAVVHGGRLAPGPGVTDLRIDARHRRRVVDGLLSGVHVPGESHFELLGAFADAELLGRAIARARALGYRSHELGDSLLLLPA